MLKTSSFPHFILIEDDEDDRFIMREALRDSGCLFDLLEFENGFRFLSHLQQKFDQEDPVDQSFLVILDMQLPGMHGLEVLQIIRGNAYWKQIPVIVLSGRIDLYTAIKMQELGVTGFLPKPDNIEELAQRINLTFKPALERYVAGLNSRTGGMDALPELRGPGLRRSGIQPVELATGVVKVSG